MYLFILLDKNVNNGIIFLDLVVAYKKLTLEKNTLEETLKTSLNYEKDDLSETASEVQKLDIQI